jgi:hypothetical protein
VLNVFRVTHKYGAYNAYVETAMTCDELSDVAVALELAFYEAQGKSHANTLGAPDLVYLLAKHYGCREVNHKRWKRTCARHRKSFDLYWNWERHRAWKTVAGAKDTAAVAKLVPATVLADVSALPELMRDWYAAREAEMERWAQQQELGLGRDSLAMAEGEQMEKIFSLEEAKALLAQDENLMIRMAMDSSCWIQEGKRDEDNNLVANGKKIAELDASVFDALIPEMDQVFCSEYFQKRVISKS